MSRAKSAFCVLICCFYSALATAGAGPVASADLMVQFDPQEGELPEGIALRHGSLYVGVSPANKIFRIEGKDEAAVYARLPQCSMGQGFMTGLAFDDAGALYAGMVSFAPALRSGIYRVPPEGGEGKLFAAHPRMTFPNELVFDNHGTLVVTDSAAGAVYKIGAEGAVEIWVEHDLLKGAQGFCGHQPTPFSTGANGMVIVPDKEVLVVNTNRASLVRIPIQPDGSAGAPECVVESDCANLEGADGMIMDEEGSFLIAVNRHNKIVRIARNKAVTVMQSGGMLDFPASLRMAVVDGRKHLYVVNTAVLSVQSGQKGRPGVVRMILE